MDDITVRYINKVCELYSLDNTIKSKMLRLCGTVEKQFEGYSWEDVSKAIDYYYVKKDDKNYPKISHIMAILNTDKNVVKAKKEHLEEIVRPFTHICLIKDVFLKTCKAMHLLGIARFDYFSLIEKTPAGNSSYIKILETPKGKEERIWSRKWDWDDALLEAKQRFPDQFAKFQNMTLPEQYALAIKLGVLKI